MGIDNFLLLATGAIAAPATFLVNERLKQGPVRASAGLSLVVALIFYAFPHSLDPFLVKNIPIVFIGASFIGMVSSRLITSYVKIGIAGIIFCILYLNASRFFNGYGGALGTAASISLLAVLSISHLRPKSRPINGSRRLHAQQDPESNR